MKKKTKGNTGFHEPRTDSHGEPGVKIPVPGHNDLRPGGLDERYHYGPGRECLKYMDGTSQIHDFGSPGGWPAQSPASAQHTIGLRKNPKKGENDPAGLTIQPGIARVR